MRGYPRLLKLSWIVLQRGGGGGGYVTELLIIRALKVKQQGALAWKTEIEFGEVKIRC